MVNSNVGIIKHALLFDWRNYFLISFTDAHFFVYNLWLFPISTLIILNLLTTTSTGEDSPKKTVFDVFNEEKNRLMVGGHWWSQMVSTEYFNCSETWLQPKPRSHRRTPLQFHQNHLPRGKGEDVLVKETATWTHVLRNNRIQCTLHLLWQEGETIGSIAKCIVYDYFSSQQSVLLF